MAEEARVERVERMVLVDEFLNAAMDYGEELVKGELRGQIGNLNALVRSRERFIQARAMLYAEETGKWR